MMLNEQTKATHTHRGQMPAPGTPGAPGAVGRPVKADTALSTLLGDSLTLETEVPAELQMVTPFKKQALTQTSS